MAGYLAERELTRVFFAGLAYDYCVGYSALDARRLGLQAYVLRDACRAIDLNGSVAAIEAELAKAGVSHHRNRRLLSKPSRRIATGFALWSRLNSMSRNFYILAASLLLFALISAGMSLVPFQLSARAASQRLALAHRGMFLLLFGLIAALIGVMSHLFEQVDRHSEQDPSGVTAQAARQPQRVTARTLPLK